ncbi:MAG: hypothetical protein SFY95_05690 [Planctomycetota bacterium]|nr:hypothetical protein [Planctomycetota bacterium]
MASAAETRAVKMLIEDLELASFDGERATIKAPGVLFEVARGQSAALEALIAKVTGRAARVEIATDDPLPTAAPAPAKARSEPPPPVQRRSRVIEDEPAAEVIAAPPADEPPFGEVPLVKETLAAFEASLGQVHRRPRAGGTGGSGGAQ